MTLNSNCGGGDPPEKNSLFFIDMNEDSLKGNIDAMLGSDGLEMTEVVCSTHPELLVPPPSDVVTIADAMQLMDAMPRLTSEYSRQSGWQLAIFKCPGDHLIPIIDFKYKDMLGEHVLKIVHPQA